LKQEIIQKLQQITGRSKLKEITGAPVKLTLTAAQAAGNFLFYNPKMSIMAHKQKGRKGREQNQEMNRSSGSLSDSNRTGQNQQTQNTGARQRESESGMGRSAGKGDRGNIGKSK